MACEASPKGCEPSELGESQEAVELGKADRVQASGVSHGVSLTL